jgi:hypothetical protein
MKNYHNLFTRVENIITNKGYRLSEQPIENNGTYIFNIYHNEKVITNLQISNSTGTIIHGKTRSSYNNPPEDTPVFTIGWVSTETLYQGQHLGILIIIYGICYLKERFASVNYVKLDDDTNNSLHIKKNIYNRLGFVFQNHIELDMFRDILIISGPEKQLQLDNNFINNATNKLRNKN